MTDTAKFKADIAVFLQGLDDGRWDDFVFQTIAETLKRLCSESAGQDVLPRSIAAATYRFAMQTVSAIAWAQNPNDVFEIDGIGEDGLSERYGQVKMLAGALFDGRA